MIYIESRKDWLRGYDYPPVFPVVVDIEGKLIYDFTRTFPLKVSTSEITDNVKKINFNRVKSSNTFLDILANKEFDIKTSHKDKLDNILTNNRAHTAPLAILNESVRSYDTNRMDIILPKSIIKLNMARMTHRLSFRNLDTSNLDDSNRIVDVVGLYKKWIGYTCIVTSKNVACHGIVEIVDSDWEDSVNLKCLALSDQGMVKRGYIYPLFKRGLLHE